MRGFVFASLFFAITGCAAQTPQVRAANYKRAIDAARGVCVAVSLDFEAPTDRSTLARCSALREAE